MENRIDDICYQGMLNLLWDVRVDLLSSIEAYDFEIKKQRDIYKKQAARRIVSGKYPPSFVSELAHTHDQLRNRPFSEIRSYSKSKHAIKGDFNRELYCEMLQCLHGVDLLSHYEKDRSKLFGDFEKELQPDFELADDIETFSKDFFTIHHIFIFAGLPRDPRIDLAVSKAIFQAGKIIQLLKDEGAKRSDGPKNASRSKRKGYIDEQVYFDLFHSMDVGKKSRHDVAKKLIREAGKLEEKRSEAKEENPKKIHSNKHVRTLLKSELDKLFQ